MGIVTLFVVSNIIGIVACHMIAKRRGAKPVFWGLMGALFGILAIPFAMRAEPA